MIEDHQINDGPVRALLETVVADLLVARIHIEKRNYGLADNWIEQAINKLPQENGVHRLAWPTIQEYELIRTESGGDK